MSNTKHGASYETTLAGYSLRTGGTRSCGCLKRENGREMIAANRRGNAK